MVDAGNREAIRRARRRFKEMVAVRRLQQSMKPPPKRGVRFFPNEGFPRVKLKFKEQLGDDGIRTFLGLLPSPLHTVDAQVRTILTELSPFISETHWQRRVPVEIYAPHDSQIASVLTDWQVTESANAADSFVMFSTHKFQVKTICGGSIQSPEDLASLDAKLPLCGVEVTRTPSLEQIVLDGRLFHGLLRQVPRRFQQVACQLLQWRVSRVVCRMGSSQNLPALCSALPHRSSIESLEVRCGTPENMEQARSTSNDWAWLGYAVFHPDAARHSALTSISIDLIGASKENMDAFESMDRGNNLSREGEATSNKYVEGFIEAPTAVWSQSGGDPSRSTLQSYLSKTWVTVCVSSIEEAVGKEWLRVVNPGIGFGHIRRSGVSEWRSRPPGQPSVQSVRIEEMLSSEASSNSGSSVDPQIHDERVMRFLRLAGGSLTALDWQGSQHISTWTMLDLRMSCPRLKYLRVGHDGAVWADPSGTTNWPELEELEFDLVDLTDHRLEREVRPLRTDCMPKLNALKLNVGRNPFTTSKDKMVQILRDHKELQFMWWSSRVVPYSATAIISRSDDTAKREFEKQIRELALDIVRSPRELARRLAFLSVVSAKAQGLSGNFGSDVSALVFSFEPRVVQREIYIDL